jgi:NAD(P)-dependent dehydrogenase (short-subunit alcohol dehydrogenase family)
MKGRYVMKIQGTVALVTGSNRGLGKAIVTALLEAGAAKVHAADRDVSKLTSTDPRVVPLARHVATRTDRGGDTSVVLAERKPDVERRRETVGSSFGLLVVLLDVGFVWTDDVNPVSPALQGLRDRLSRLTPSAHELREDRDESSHYGNNSETTWRIPLTT